MLLKNGKTQLHPQRPQHFSSLFKGSKGCSVKTVFKNVTSISMYDFPILHYFADFRASYWQGYSVQSQWAKKNFLTDHPPKSDLWWE